MVTQTTFDVQADKVAVICREIGVKRLELFGGAANGEFNPETDDLEFIVDFLPEAHRSWGAEYSDLTEQLAGLYGHTVDLYVDENIRYPELRRCVDETRTLIYEG